MSHKTINKLCISWNKIWDMITTNAWKVHNKSTYKVTTTQRKEHKLFRNVNNCGERHVMNNSAQWIVHGLNGCSFFSGTEEQKETKQEMLLSCQHPAALMIIFNSPFSHLVIWTAQRSSRRCEISKRSKGVWWHGDSQNCYLALK